MHEKQNDVINAKKKASLRESTRFFCHHYILEYIVLQSEVLHVNFYDAPVGRHR